MKLSVLMAVYNGEKYLKEAMESVLNQTFGDFEFIIINDGSTDKSGEILKNYAEKDLRIKLVVHIDNLYLPKSLNEGIKMAKGEYIARMDADDISFPERLAKQIDFMDKNPNVVAVGTFAEIINGEGEKIGEHRPPIKYEEIKKRMFFAGQICHPSVMFRKKAVEEIGGYDEDLRYAQDYDLWFRLIKKYQVANLPEFLVAWRDTEGNISDGTGRAKKKKQRQMAIKARVRAIKNGIYPFWYFVFLPWDYVRDFLPEKILGILRRLVVRG